MSDAPLVRRTSRSLSVVVAGEFSRKLARRWVEQAQDGMVITVEAERRTLDQSSKFWALCSDLARSDLTWDGDRQSKDGWHALLIHAWMIATGKQPRLVAGLNGGQVALLIGTRSMTKSEMSELLDFSIAWAAEKGIAHEPA